MYIYISPCLVSYLYLGDFADSLNLRHVSWVGALSSYKAFQQDGQSDCCGGEIPDPLVPGESNHEANLPLSMYDLPLVAFKLFKYAFIPALNKERCTGCETVYHHQTLSLSCASSCLFPWINSSRRSHLRCTNTRCVHVFLAVVLAMR